jgi:hypothetical protein
VTTDEALLEATNRLARNVEVLTEQLTVQRDQARRVRVVAAAVVLLLAMVLLGGWYSLHETQDTQVQSCENANETRAANLSLWSTVLGTIQESNPDARAWVDPLLEWVALLYQPHDCDDLNRDYEVPPPPKLSPTG